MNNKITIIFHLIVGCSCNYIQKCCDINQQLSANFNECIDFNGTRGIDKYEVDQSTVDTTGVNFIKMGKKDRHHIWWLPSEVQFLSANVSGTALQPLSIDKVQNLRVLYNRKNPCQQFSEMLLAFNDYLYLLDNGSLLVTGNADNVRPETMIFPPKVFCLDRVSLLPSYHRSQKSTHQILDHSFAILVCPSLVYSCVRMCCHKRNYLKVHDGLEKCEYAQEIPATWSLQYIDYEGKAMENSQNFGIVEGIPTCKNYYYLNDNSSTHTKSFWILPDGSVRVENRSTDVSASDYCIHFLNIQGHYQLNLRVCPEMFDQNEIVQENRTQPVPARSETSSPCVYSEKLNEFKDSLYKVYFVAGATALALTLLVYVFMLKQRMSVFDKILNCHVASLFVCYSTMAFEKIVKPASIKMSGCELLGYVIQYTFMASTLWLNAMCLYIYQSFSGDNIAGPRGKYLNKSNKFLLYSIYVWGGAAIISFGTFVMDNTGILDFKYRPQFGINSCWLRNPPAQLIYFYSPLAVIITLNLCLSIFTLKQIFAMQNESQELNTLESKKYVGNNEAPSKSFRVSLFIRLFSLTGITWIFEIVSFSVGGPDYFWYIPDAVNSLRGVLVFILCCCKKEVLMRIFKRTSLSSSPINGGICRLSHTSSTDTKSTSTYSVQMMSLRKGSAVSADEESC